MMHGSMNVKYIYRWTKVKCVMQISFIHVQTHLLTNIQKEESSNVSQPRFNFTRYFMQRNMLIGALMTIRTRRVINFT